MGAVKTRTKITPAGQPYVEIGTADGGYIFVGEKGIALLRKLKKRKSRKKYHELYKM